MSKHSEFFSEKKKEISEKEVSAKEELERVAKETEEKVFNYLKFIGLISGITTFIFLIIRIFKKKKKKPSINKSKKNDKPKREYVPKKSTISALIIERTIATIFPMIVKAVTNSLVNNNSDKDSEKKPMD